MRWLYATITLLAMSVSLGSWVYLRDRDTNWQPPEPRLARTDAKIALNYALRGDPCRSGCWDEVLDQTCSGDWLVRLTIRHRPRCLLIDVHTFTLSEHGLSGVRLSRCCSGKRRDGGKMPRVRSEICPTP
jgi:hypothetical protein